MTIPILTPNSTSLLFVKPSEFTVGYVVQVTLETACVWRVDLSSELATDLPYSAHTAGRLSEPQKLKQISVSFVWCAWWPSNLDCREP